MRPFKGMKAKERLEILGDLVNIGLVETEVNNLNGKETQCFRLLSLTLRHIHPKKWIFMQRGIIILTYYFYCDILLAVRA